MSVTIYIEGGGYHSKELQTLCREGFRKLLEKAGFRDRMPRLVACGPRDNTYRDFRIALRHARMGEYPILLVDSEDPVNTPQAWEHLQRRDSWARPEGAEAAQAHLMVTCMETWVIADRATLSAFFGHCLHEGALLPENNLETRSKEDVQTALENATHGCGRDREYSKGRRSFQLVGELNPEVLRARLPHFQSLLDALNHQL